MREILFRGKRLDNGEWVEGYLAGYGLISPGEPQDVSHVTGDYYDQTPYVGFVEVDPTTVGQFTGLLDKNGKRIFEGYIVEDNWITAGVVKFLEGTYDSGIYRYNGWVVEHPDGDVDHRALVYGKEEWMNPVVLGNIHDNPELLEVTPDE